MENSRGVRETKWHDKVEGIAKAKFSEHRGTMEGEKAELMSVKGYLFLTVILFSPQKSMHDLSNPSFFLTKKTSPYRRGRRPDMSCSQGILDVPLHSLLLRDRAVKQPATGERISRLEVNSAVVRPMRRQRQGVVLAEHRS